LGGEEGAVKQSSWGDAGHLVEPPTHTPQPRTHQARTQPTLSFEQSKIQRAGAGLVLSCSEHPLAATALPARSRVQANAQGVPHVVAVKLTDTEPVSMAASMAASAFFLPGLPPKGLLVERLPVSCCRPHCTQYRLVPVPKVLLRSAVVMGLAVAMVASDRGVKMLAFL